MCTLDALLGISRTIDLPLGALMDHLQPNGRCWCCDVGQTSCWRPPFFFVFLLHFPFFLLHMTLHRERAANNGQKRRTALNYGRSHQNCTIWKLSWQLPWYSGHYDARKSRKTAAKKPICSRVCKGQAGGISPPFHCHFTFRRCAKRCGETKSPFFGVQDAGCRIQNSKWFGEKTRRLRGLGSQLETACLFARWHAAWCTWPVFFFCCHRHFGVRRAVLYAPAACWMRGKVVGSVYSSIGGGPSQAIVCHAILSPIRRL